MQRDNLSGEEKGSRRTKRKRKKKGKEKERKGREKRSARIDSKVGGSHLWKRNPRRSRPFLSHCRENSRAKAVRRVDSDRSPLPPLPDWIPLVLENCSFRSWKSYATKAYVFFFFPIRSFFPLCERWQRLWCKVFPRKKCYCCRWPRYPRSLSCPTSISSDFWWRDRVGCPSFRMMLLFRIWSLELDALSLSFSLSAFRSFCFLFSRCFRLSWGKWNWWIFVKIRLAKIIRMKIFYEKKQIILLFKKSILGIIDIFFLVLIISNWEKNNCNDLIHSDSLHCEILVFVELMLILTHAYIHSIFIRQMSNPLDIETILCHHDIKISVAIATD